MQMWNKSCIEFYGIPIAQNASGTNPHFLSIANMPRKKFSNKWKGKYECFPMIKVFLKTFVPDPNPFNYVIGVTVFVNDNVTP